MTTTATEAVSGLQDAPGQGRVARVIGPVVDVEFPADAVPDIYNALTVEIDMSDQGDEKFTLTMEVNLHLGDNLVRAVALKPTDGLRSEEHTSDLQSRGHL